MAERRKGEGARHDQTKRVVLELVHVPRDAGDDEMTIQEAWVERGVFEGSIVQAVEAFAGKPGTPDAKVGVFKAVPERSFTGGVEYVQPDRPLVQRKVVT